MATKKMADLISSMNESASGTFVGITDYVNSKGEVSSIVGQIGCSYEVMKQKNIDKLTGLIAEGFEPITVKGQCRKKDGVFNSRARSGGFFKYTETFTPEQVKEAAETILDGLLNPKQRASNKTNLTGKEGGLSYYSETGKFNFSLLVQSQTFKQEKTDEAQNGMEVKQKSKHPDTALNEAIRAMYEVKPKHFTIGKDKFDTIKIDGTIFEANTLTF